jgi:hypothetical protein
MTDIYDLPPKIRARRYLELAGDARREAAMAKGSVRESYLLLAENWDNLAALAAKEAETSDRET